MSDPENTLGTPSASERVTTKVRHLFIGILALGGALGAIRAIAALPTRVKLIVFVLLAFAWLLAELRAWKSSVPKVHSPGWKLRLGLAGLLLVLLWFTVRPPQDAQTQLLIEFRAFVSSQEDDPELVSDAKKRQMAKLLEGADPILQNSPDDFLARAHAYRLMGEHIQAIREYDRAILAVPEFPEALCGKGTSLLRLRRFAEALKAFDAAVKSRSEYAEAHAGRAAALIELFRFDDALEACDRSLEYSPGYARAHSNRAAALNGLRRFDEGLAAADLAIELASNASEPYANRSYALSRLGRHDEALAAVDTALKLAPRSATALATKSAVLIGLGQCDEAIKLARKARQIAPDDFCALNNLAVALNLKGRHSEAEEVLTSAITVSPSAIDAYINRSVARQALGHTEAALADCDRAIEINPEAYEPQHNRVVLLVELGRHEEATHQLREILARWPKARASGAMYNLACLLSIRGKGHESLEWLEKAMLADPRLRESARYDADFDWLRNTPEFSERFFAIVGG